MSRPYWYLCPAHSSELPRYTVAVCPSSSATSKYRRDSGLSRPPLVVTLLLRRHRLIRAAGRRFPVLPAVHALHVGLRIQRRLHRRAEVAHARLEHGAAGGRERLLDQELEAVVV